MKAKIAVLAGDGVGREIVPEAVKVLKVVGEKFGHSFEFANGDIGGQAIDKVGVPLPQDTLMLAKQSDAVLLGAVGGPKWEGLDYSLRPERALLGLREALGLYANLRPAKLYPNLADASTLKREIVEGIDILPGTHTDFLFLRQAEVVAAFLFHPGEQCRLTLGEIHQDGAPRLDAVRAGLEARLGHARPVTR